MYGERVDDIISLQSIKIDMKENISEKINKIIEKMSIDEKIGQLTQEYVTKDRIGELISLAEKGEIGSCILASTPLAGDSEQEEFYLSRLNEIQKVAVEKSPSGVPIIFGRDIIHGSKTIFPIPLAQAATWDYDLIKSAASVMSYEASREGVHWTFAPMLDICVDPRWGRIIETPGEDSYLGEVMAKASIEGIQGADMSEKGKLAACAKHYIGYGASGGGRDKDPTEWSEYTLRNKALLAFRQAIRSGVATIMSSFNEIGGQPVTSSRYLLTDILRGELGFDGFVVSDWAAIQRLDCQGVSDNDELSAVLAINAGVDMDMVDNLYKNNLKSALAKGLVTMKTIDTAVARILGIKFKLGLFDSPYTEEFDGEIMKEEHFDLARKVSEHAMVLLKNNGVLPLEKGEKVSVTGPFACDDINILGSWCAGGKSEDTISFAHAIEEINGSENTFVEENIIAGKFSVMDMADTFIIALGEEKHITGEGKTDVNIELPQEQVNIVKHAKEMGKKIVAVIFAGRPLAIREILPYCDAVLWAWHGGTMCSYGAADIIFGDFNPCGKLPVTIPRYTGQIPIFYNHNRNEYIKSGYYSHNSYVATDCLSTPEFVFGYGLSYTDFEYSNFSVKYDGECIDISFDIKNTGNVDGFEIAQCYVSDLVASMSRPIKELKAFSKTEILAGQVKNIKMTLTKENLSFYDAHGNFVFEEGEFKIGIGKNSKDICFEKVLYVK